MHFSHDTEVALVQTAALVNTLDGGVDRLTTVADLDAFLTRYPMSGVRRRTTEELEQVRRFRGRLQALWSVRDRAEAAARINDILAEADARPYLSKHDALDWHLHVTDPKAPLSHRLGAEAAMAMLDLVRGDDLGRLKTCAADDCASVLVDLSRNSSKRYCDTGNCGNRAHVAAYRARKRRAGQPG